MAEKRKEDRRSRLGFGSTYRKGSEQDLDREREIQAVLGGQVWMVKPEKRAEATHPCLWMQAGVANFKNCNNYYDCNTCKYDLGMHKQVEKGKQISWQDAMRRVPDMDRVCRHSLTERIGHRLCAYNYECASCDFDQFFEDVWAAKTKTVPIRIGLDDFALKLLGKADALDLPLMGNVLDPDKPGWGLKRKDNNADVLSPIGGVIMEVNSKVRENPELANREPYGDGWLFMVRTPDIKKSMQQLMTNTDSLDWIKAEVNHLETMIEEVAGPLAADGGYLQADIYGNLPDLGWASLTKTFLRT